MSSATNFHGINTPTMTNFRLPAILKLAYKIPVFIAIVHWANPNTSLFGTLLLCAAICNIHAIRDKEFDNLLNLLKLSSSFLTTKPPQVNAPALRNSLHLQRAAQSPSSQVMWTEFTFCFKDLGQEMWKSDSQDPE